ncbi:MAG TPA: hypothetical protein VGM54_02670 [Chthoniobacter sp.]|jgi:hypothetical protein
MKTQLLPGLSRFISSVAVGALCSASAFAQLPATTAPGAPGAAAAPAQPLAMNDQTYLRAAIKSLYYQVQLATAAKSLGDLNLARLRDETTKNLGAAMQSITKIAQAHGEKVPTEVSGTDKVDYDRVIKAKPDKLAKEWTDALAKEAKHLDHETATAEKTVQDPDLKTFITNYGPSIRATFTSADAADKTQKKLAGAPSRR